jgi:hypothetical protein
VIVRVNHHSQWYWEWCPPSQKVEQKVAWATANRTTIRNIANWPKRIKIRFGHLPNRTNLKLSFLAEKKLLAENIHLAESNIFFCTIRPVAESHITHLYVSANYFLAETYDIPLKILRVIGENITSNRAIFSILR